MCFHVFFCLFSCLLFCLVVSDVAVVSAIPFVCLFDCLFFSWEIRAVVVNPFLVHNVEKWRSTNLLGSNNVDHFSHYDFLLDTASIMATSFAAGGSSGCEHTRLRPNLSSSGVFDGSSAYNSCPCCPAPRVHHDAPTAAAAVRASGTRYC